MDFCGKVAVITGGSSGIGKSTALELTKEGCKVIILGKTKQKVLSSLEELKTISKDCSAYVCDINEENKIKYIVNEIINKYGKIDFLINCAGSSKYREFREMTTEEIKNIVATNFLGTVYFCKYVIPFMEREQKGHIINIASVAGKFGFPKLSVYCGSKSAVIGFSEAIYYELKNKGIRVSVVCPGATETDFYRDESFQKFPHDKRHKKVLKPEDVANEIKKIMISGKFESVIPKSFRIKIILKEALKPFIMWYINRLPR